MSSGTVNVFISYAHEDEKLRDGLAKHLAGLTQRGYISTWSDRQIPPGSEWDKEIKDSLNTADIILLLVSSDFMASDFCSKVEVKRALERHKSGKACVIPVILRSCDWRSPSLRELQALPKNGEPVCSEVWHTTDDAFNDIVRGIKKVVDDLREKRRAVTKKKYETACWQFVQQEYPLTEAMQSKLKQLQVALDLTDSDIAPVVARVENLEKYRQQVRVFIREDGNRFSPINRHIFGQSS